MFNNSRAKILIFYELAKRIKGKCDNMDGKIED